MSLPHLERLMTTEPAAALNGAGIMVLGHVGADNRPALLAGLRGHRVLDLAGIAAVRDYPGITYQGLCW